MEIDADPGSGDIRKTVRRLWRRKWWIAAPIVLLVTVSVARSLRAADVYSSSTNVRQADPNSFVVFQTQPGTAANPARQTATQIELVRSEAVETLVRDDLGDRFDRIADLRIARVGETDILRIEIRSADPELARDAANAYAASYLEISQDSQARALEQQSEELSAFNRANQARIIELSDEITRLDAEIAELGPSAAQGSAEAKSAYDTARSDRQLAEVRRSSLILSSQTMEERVVQLQVEANARRDVAGQVLRPATLPSSPVNSGPVRDGLVYAMVGGLVGLALAWARDGFGGRLRDMESVTSTAPHLPVLGTPMRLDVGRRAPASDVLITLRDGTNTPSQEAYRALRTSVQTATSGSTLLVTSPGAREGKTTTVANLAGSLAVAGAKVAVVCLDLHRPNVHEVFSRPNAVGLTSVLLGTHTLDEALRPIEAGGGVLRLLPSGPLPPNPAELLGSTAVGDVLAGLARTFDYVLLDTPPVMSVTDPIVASRWADHVLLVVRAGRTTTRSLRLTLERLHRARIEPLGLVFNGATASTGAAYYYGGYHIDSSTDADIPRREWDRLVRANGNAVDVSEVTSGPSSRAADEPSARKRPH